jgi:ABC-2 type transport system permease protein
MSPTPSPPARIAHQLRYDLRAFRRNRQAVVSTVALPAILLAILVSANDNERTSYAGRTVSLAQYLTPGLIAFGIVAASFLSLVVDVVAQRESGVLKRRRATPVTAAVLVGGRTLTAAVASLAVAFLLLTVAGNRYGVVIPAAGLPALALTVALGAVTFASLGYALATAIRTPGAAQPTASLVLLPLLMISGVLVPTNRLPERLDTIARVFPLEHLANALRYALDPAVTGHHLAGADLAVLAAWAVGAFAVAHVRFAWLPRSR